MKPVHYFIKTLRIHFLMLVLFSSCLNSNQVNLKGHWEGSLTSGGKSIAISLDFTDKEGFFDIPEMGLFSQQFKNIETSGGIISMEVSEGETVYISGELSGNTINAVVESDTEILMDVSRVSDTPLIYKEEEVSYKSGNNIIYGSLIHPLTPGLHPAVVFIHGSGKMTRETMQNRAYLFVKNGYAALIYDRQGRGKSTGNTENILPMNTLAADAIAGVEYLAARNDINHNKIGIYGISQGAWVAPLCASITDKIAFMITISAPGINPDKQNSFAAGNIVGNRLKDIFMKSKIPQAEAENIVESVIANHRIYSEKINAESTIETVPGFSFFEPVPVWQKIKIPVLAVWGENDELVPAKESSDILEASLQNAGNKNYTFRIFKDADHSLKQTGESFAGKWKLTAPGCNELIINWINVHIK